MPRGARLCVHCGYDLEARSRVIVQADPPPPQAPPARPGPWTGPAATSGAVLLVFGAAAPLAWKHPAGTIAYASAAALLTLVLWFVQRSRAVREAVDPDDELPDDDPALRATVGLFDLAAGGDDEDDRRRRRVRAAILHEMFSRRTAGRVQSALLASLLALIAAGWLLWAAFGPAPR